MVATIPADGAIGVTRDPLIRIEFDRPLSARALATAEIRLRSGEVGIGIEVETDPISHSLEVRVLRPLLPEVAYVLEVEMPEDLDGNVGDAVELRFTTSDDDTPVPVRTATWADVEPTFRLCAACHDASEPPMGMDLSTPEAIARTALGVPARQVAVADGATAASAGLTGMARIEPGRPDRSYLVYKVLGDPHILGERMPRSLDPLSPAEIEALGLWIRAGAPLGPE